MNDFEFNFNAVVPYKIIEIYDYDNIDDDSNKVKINNVRNIGENIYTLLTTVLVNWQNYFDYDLHKVVEVDIKAKLEIVFKLDITSIKLTDNKDYYDVPLKILNVRFLDDSDKNLTKAQKESVMDYFTQAHDSIDLDYYPIARFTRA